MQDDPKEKGEISIEMKIAYFMSIYGYIRQMVAEDNIVNDFSLDSVAKRMNLLSIFNHLRVFITKHNEYANEPGLIEKNLESIGITYSADKSRIETIAFDRKSMNPQARALIEYYDDNSISSISLVFNKVHTAIVTPVYSEEEEIQSFKVEMSTDYDSAIGPSIYPEITIPAGSLEELISYFFPSDDKEARNLKIEELKQNKELFLEFNVDTIESYKRGIIFNTWEDLREALIIYGEGKFVKRGAKNKLDLENEAFIDATPPESDVRELTQTFLSAIRSTSTDSVSDFVDAYFPFKANFQPGEVYEQYFDYGEMGLWSNNFFKSTIKITKTEDGRYILEAWAGSSGDSLEKRLAESLLTERVALDSTVRVYFPTIDNYFWVGGLDKIQTELAKHGYVTPYQFTHLIYTEGIPLGLVHSKEKNTLEYNYVYDSNKVIIPIVREGLPFNITLELVMPRECRAGYTLEQSEEEGEKSYKPEVYDNWTISTDGTDINGTIIKSGKGEVHLPYIKIRVFPNIRDFLDQEGDPYSQEVARAQRRIVKEVATIIAGVKLN